MKNQLLRKALPVVLAAASVCAISAPAAAAPTSYSITSIGIDPSPGGLTGTIHYNPVGGTAFNVDANIGRIALTYSGGSLKTYCADIFDKLSTGTFTAAAMQSLPFTLGSLQKVRTFLTNVEPMMNGSGANQLMSAAAQLGVWELLYDSPNKSGLYDVKSGVFSASDVSSSDNLYGTYHGISYDARDLANTWLGDVTSGTWKAVDGMGLSLVTPGAGNQAQILVRSVATGGDPLPNAPTGAVPEPATWATMIIGFGAVGATMRRRRGVLARA